MNLKDILKISAILSVIGCSPIGDLSSYQKINEEKIGGNLVELHKSKSGAYKLVINEPAEHFIFNIKTQYGIVRTFYLDNRFNIKSESVEGLVFPLGEGCGFTSENIPKEDRAKAEACLDSLLN